LIVTIVGVGLIGGSMGMGLIESGFAELVYGYDPRPKALEVAANRKCIQVAIGSLEDAVDCDLWILACPPSQMESALVEIERIRAPESTITDVGSIKSAVMDAVPESLRPYFVGGHPMAGREQTGVEFSRPSLFEGCKWVLCPFAETSTASIRWVERMVFALDASPIRMSPDEHDKHVAMVSHLPHILASCLVELAEDLDHPMVHGGSWSDLTRVAGSNPRVWADILAHNREAVLASMSTLSHKLDHCQRKLAEASQEEIAEWLNEIIDRKIRQTTSGHSKVHSST
jgi:prephenate dehydrogenase